jgi:Fe2+ or Zn2+ uptake regulation protein
MELTSIGGALSNETRVKILNLISAEDKSSIATHEEYKKRFSDSKHRETIYRELENLVESGLVEKYYDDQEQQLKYSLSHEKILIDLGDNSITPVEE